MRILAIAALAGTILAGAVSISQAAVIPVALLGGTGGATYTHSPVSGNSSFTDAFTFTLSSPSIVTFPMETSFTGGKPTPSITGATFGLYKGMPSVLGGIGTASLVAAITTTGGNHSRTGSDLTGTSLSAGS